MAKKILITGMTGFAGSFLAENLVEKNIGEVTGTYLTEASLENITKIRGKVKAIHADLQESKKIEEVIASIKPDWVFHLAAMPAVGGSFAKPAETIINNVVSEVNLLEGIKNAGLLKCRILIVSSADVYGKVVAKDLPIDEETPFMPTNAYAVSKITQDFLGLQYAISYNLQVIRVRPFNHFGPRQATGFVVADWCKKIALIEKGRITPIIKVGNVAAKRDFTDVRDMVKAYTLAIEKGIFGDVYNIGSGVSYQVGDVLSKLLKFAKTRIDIVSDANLFRPQDSDERVCNNQKFVQLTGWKPTISLEETLEETLDYWRNIV